LSPKVLKAVQKGTRGRKKRVDKDEREKLAAAVQKVAAKEDSHWSSVQTSSTGPVPAFSPSDASKVAEYMKRHRALDDTTNTMDLNSPNNDSDKHATAPTTHRRILREKENVHSKQEHFIVAPSPSPSYSTFLGSPSTSTSPFLANIAKSLANNPPISFPAPSIAPSAVTTASVIEATPIAKRTRTRNIKK
jgi:hypothetical protein